MSSLWRRKGKKSREERWFEKKFTISSDSGRHPSNVDHVHKEDMKVGNKRVFLNILEEKIIFWKDFETEVKRREMG